VNAKLKAACERTATAQMDLVAQTARHAEERRQLARLHVKELVRSIMAGAEARAADERDLEKAIAFAKGIEARALARKRK
jgi:hypothetical protein